MFLETLLAFSLIPFTTRLFLLKLAGFQSNSRLVCLIEILFQPSASHLGRRMFYQNCTVQLKHGSSGMGPFSKTDCFSLWPHSFIIRVSLKCVQLSLQLCSFGIRLYIVGLHGTWPKGYLGFMFQIKVSEKWDPSDLNTFRTFSYPHPK